MSKTVYKTKHTLTLAYNLYQVSSVRFCDFGYSERVCIKISIEFNKSPLCEFLAKPTISGFVHEARSKLLKMPEKSVGGADPSPSKHSRTRMHRMIQIFFSSFQPNLTLK